MSLIMNMEKEWKWLRPWTEQEPGACMEPFVHLRPHTHKRSRIRTTPTEPRMMMPV